MTKFYCQCQLRKLVSNDSYKIDIAWIPEKFAIINKFVKIKTEDGWDEGWQVVDVRAKQKADLVEAKARDYLKQRKASDI